MSVAGIEPHTTQGECTPPGRRHAFCVLLSHVHTGGEEGTPCAEARASSRRLKIGNTASPPETHEHNRVKKNSESKPPALACWAISTHVRYYIVLTTVGAAILYTHAYHYMDWCA